MSLYEFLIESVSSIENDNIKSRIANAIVKSASRIVTLAFARLGHFIIKQLAVVQSSLCEIFDVGQRRYACVIQEPTIDRIRESATDDLAHHRVTFFHILWGTLKCVCPPENGEITLWPSTNGAIAYFLVLSDGLLIITEITENNFFSPLKPSRKLKYKSE